MLKDDNDRILGYPSKTSIREQLLKNVVDGYERPNMFPWDIVYRFESK